MRAAPGFSARSARRAFLHARAPRPGAVVCSLRGRAASAEGRAEIKAALERLDSITRVLDRDDLDALRPADKLGPLVAEAEPPWGFALSDPEAGSNRGSHGSLREIEVPLLLSGAGIRRGEAPRNPRTVDVAPTISALLGARPPADAQGRPLTESIGAPGRGGPGRGPRTARDLHRLRSARA